MTKSYEKRAIITKVPKGSVDVSEGPIILERPKSTSFSSLSSV